MRGRILAWAAAALTVISLAPGFGGDWVYDDYPYVVQNRDLNGGVDRLARLFTVSFPSHAPERGLYRPVTALSYRLDHVAGRPDPRLSDAINLALAAWLVLAVYGLLRRLTSDVVAVGGTFVFAVHPVHVEAMAWTTGRSEVLAALFGVLALGWALDAARGDGGRRRAVAAGVALLAGFLAKESAVVFWPLLVGWLAVAHRGRWGERGVRWSVGAFTAAGLAGLALRWSAIGAWGPEAGNRVGAAALLDRLPLVVAAAGEHLRLLLVPYPLSLERMTTPPSEWSDPRVVVGAVVLALWIALVVALRKRSPWREFAIWPVVALAPVLHLVPIGEAAAERFLLIPSIGAAALLGTLAVRRWGRVALGVVVLAGLAGSSLYARTWHDEGDVWRHALRHEPQSAVAWAALGDSYAHRDWPDKATPHYRRALEIAPDLTACRLALAQSLDALGHAEAALEESSEAVRRDPDDPVALNNLGARLARAGRVPEAAKMFRQAVARAPNYAPALRNAAFAALEAGDAEEAADLLERARRADPEAPGLDGLAAEVEAARR